MFNVEDLKLRRRSWMKIAAIPYNRLGWEFLDCTGVSQENIDSIKEWIDVVEEGKIIRAAGQVSCGLGIVLYGEPGHGKTTLSLVTLQDILRRFPLEAFSPLENKTLVRPCYFMTFTSILDLKGALMEDPSEEERSLFAGILGECQDDAYNIRVLVIDDVGKEQQSGSGWQKTILHHVLRTRFNNGLPTIVTSNIPLEAWGSVYGPATESFAREAFVPIALKSPKGDLRK
jgi:DNA replication protein DnaC